MTHWKSEDFRKHLEEETGNLLKWEADEEMASKELDGKLKHVGEVKAAQELEIQDLEEQNENLRRRVAVAEQKKEEVRKKALFTNRKAEVLFDHFDNITINMERLQSRDSGIQVFNVVMLMESKNRLQLTYFWRCCGGEPRG